MQCPRCRAENREGRRFCGECGLSFASACLSCGFLNEGSEKFCGGCGRSLTPAPTPAEPRFTSPHSYTPKHLAEKILTSKIALEGERKQVTVLFADLKGSMELLADRDPEEARKILDPVLERMMEAVHRYEGTVNQVMGDGIMALFGAPLGHEDHAVRACYAALRMQDSVKRYAEVVQRPAGVSIQIRVGLNSGEVVVRSIGSDLHMDYTAVGQTTHLAARMEQMATPGTIVLTPQTLALAEGLVQVAPLGPMGVKGLSSPLEIFQLTSASLIRSRFQATAARGLTKFVGRSLELAQLHDALQLVRGGKGQLIAVVGDAGVGKSRFFWEFTHSHALSGCLVVEAAAISYGKAMPYSPVVELLKSYFGIVAGDGAQSVREKVSGKLLSLDRALEPSLPAVLSLVDAALDDDHWKRLDPAQRRQRTLDGVRRVLLRESQVQPVVVVFEDLHWIDSETQALLDSVVESLPSVRILLLVNYRPEYEHRWGRKTYYTQLRVDALPLATAEELLDALLGDDPGIQQLKLLLIERTEGNPFFLEESVRTLVETQVLAGDRGKYRLAKALPMVQVPATVQAVLAARVDRLPPEEKRLLQSAAVVGKDVPYALLEAIAEQPEETLRRGLAHLQTAEFVYETSLFPDLQYTFKHALTHEIAYEALLHEQRRTLHAQVVEAIERLYPDRLPEQVESLAHHAFRGGLWNKSVSYLRQAGTKAAARSAHREAVSCFEQALVALAHLPESPETTAQAVDVRFDLRNSSVVLGEFQRIVEHLREAERLATNLGDQRRLGWVWVYRSQACRQTGQLADARRFGHSARAVAERLDDLALTVAVNFQLGSAYAGSGDFQKAEGLLRENLERLGDRRRERFGLAGSAVVFTRSWLTCCLGERGLFDEGVACGHEGIRLAESLDHPVSLALIGRSVGYLYLIKGDLVEAGQRLESALRITRDLNALLLPETMSFLGSVYVRSGRIADGLALLEDGVALSESLELRNWQSLISVLIGEAFLIDRRPVDALKCADRGLTLARDRGERGVEAWALRLLGEVTYRPNHPDAEISEDYYRQAIALADELGMRPLVAHCHLGFGKLYRRTGKREHAQEHLTTAATMYRDMDMRFWLEQAEAEMKELA